MDVFGLDGSASRSSVRELFQKLLYFKYYFRSLNSIFDTESAPAWQVCVQLPKMAVRHLSTGKKPKIIQNIYEIKCKQSRIQQPIYFCAFRFGVVRFVEPLVITIKCRRKK